VNLYPVECLTLFPNAHVQEIKKIWSHGADKKESHPISVAQGSSKVVDAE